MERLASDRLSAAAATSAAAVLAAEDADDSVFDEVLALVAARARRDALSCYVVRPQAVPGACPIRDRRRRPLRRSGAIGRRAGSAGARPSARRGRRRVRKRQVVARTCRPRSARPQRSPPGRRPVANARHGAGDGSGHRAPEDRGHRRAGPAAAHRRPVRGDRGQRRRRRLRLELLDLVLDAALDVHVVVVMRADQTARSLVPTPSSNSWATHRCWSVHRPTTSFDGSSPNRPGGPGAPSSRSSSSSSSRTSRVRTGRSLCLGRVVRGVGASARQRAHRRPVRRDRRPCSGRRASRRTGTRGRSG